LLTIPVGNKTAVSLEVPIKPLGMH